MISTVAMNWTTSCIEPIQNPILTMKIISTMLTSSLNGMTTSMSGGQTSQMMMMLPIEIKMLLFFMKLLIDLYLIS